MSAQSTTERAEFDVWRDDYNSAVNDATAFSGLGVDFFTRVKADYLLDLIGTSTKARADIALLDVGCGVGNYHPLLQGKVAALAGVDVSAECLTRARDANPRVDYRHFDGTHLPFADARFDIAFAVCVYHHVDMSDRGALTADVRRVLKPGGRFVIFEHNPRNPLTMRVVNNCPFDANAVLLLPRDSEALLDAAGFHDVATRHILTIPAKGRALRAIDRLASRLPFGAQYYTSGRA